MIRKFLSLIVVLVVAIAQPPVISLTQTQNFGTPASLLRFIPATQRAQSFIAWMDLTRAEPALSHLGIATPSERSSTDDVIEFLIQARTQLGLAQGPYISGYGNQANAIMDDLQANAAYDARNVLQTVRAGEPPELFAAVNLNNNTQAVLDTLLQAEALPEPTLDETYLGVPLLAWGQGLQLNFSQGLNAPAFDELGRGSRLGFLEQTVLYALTDDNIRFMVETSQGRILSLADVGEIQALAQSLASFNVYNAVLTNQTPDPFAQRQLTASTSNIIQLKPYTTLASGVSWEGEFFAVFVLFHPNAQTAGENLLLVQEKLSNEASALTRRPWSDLFNVNRAQLNVRDTLLEIRMPLLNESDVGAWFEMIDSQDSLLWHSD